MSQLENALHNDLKAVELLRDELCLQAHLFKAEVKTQWDGLEVKWGQLRERLGRAQVAAGHSRSEVDSAIRLLVDSLREGYTKIRDAMK